MAPIVVKSYVVVNHSDDCFYNGRFKNPWSGLIDGYFYSNKYAGTRKVRGRRSESHLWHKVTCNDPSCPAIKAVHSSVLVDI